VSVELFSVDSDEPLLTTTVGDHCAVAAMNRPAVHNAMNSELSESLRRYVADVEADADLRVLIITGIGPTFCAGADLKERAKMDTDDSAHKTGFFGQLAQLNRTKPWIAALNGPAWGGGVELVLSCDMTVAANNATLALPEVKRGLVALSGGVIRLPRAIPYAVALEVLLTGEPLEASRAHALGLVNYVVPAGQELDRAIELADLISRNSPSAVRESLRLARLIRNHTEDEMWAYNQHSRDALAFQPDAIEGARAFVEKRPPQWA
jgi:enoyl-CoA hydratase/carnithine racemase